MIKRNEHHDRIWPEDHKQRLEKLVKETYLKKKHVILTIVTWYEEAHISDIREDYCDMFDLNVFELEESTSNLVAKYLSKLAKDQDIERLEIGVYQIRKNGYEKLLFLRDKDVLPDFLWENCIWEPDDFKRRRGEEIKVDAYDEK